MWNKKESLFQKIGSNGKTYWVYPDGELVTQENVKQLRQKYHDFAEAKRKAEADISATRNNLEHDNVDE